MKPFLKIIFILGVIALLILWSAFIGERAEGSFLMRYIITPLGLIGYIGTGVFCSLMIVVGIWYWIFDK